MTLCQWSCSGICCGAERVCKFLPLVPSPHWEWPQNGQNQTKTKPLQPDLCWLCVTDVHHVAPHYGQRTLQMPQFSLSFLCNHENQTEINFYRVLKEVWTKPSDMALNISLCLDEFCLAVPRENDTFLLKIFIFIENHQFFMLIFTADCYWTRPWEVNPSPSGAELVLFCHLTAELGQNRAPAFPSAGYCGCIPPAGQMSVQGILLLPVF